MLAVNALPPVVVTSASSQSELHVPKRPSLPFAFATISMQHDHAIDRTKAHGTATSSMGWPLASGADRQIVPKAHEASDDLKNLFRRDEQPECVAGREPSRRTHDQSQELFVLKSCNARSNLNMVDNLCRLSQKTLSVNFVFVLARAVDLIAR